MPFILEPDDNGIIKVKPASGTVPVKPVTPSGIVPIKPASGTVPVRKPVIAEDDVKSVMKVPRDFPPKSFKLSDYGL